MKEINESTRIEYEKKNEVSKFEKLILSKSYFRFLLQSTFFTKIMCNNTENCNNRRILSFLKKTETIRRESQAMSAKNFIVLV